MKSALITTYFYLFILLSRLFFNLWDDKTKKKKKAEKVMSVNFFPVKGVLAVKIKATNYQLYVTLIPIHTQLLQTMKNFVPLNFLQLQFRGSHFRFSVNTSWSLATMLVIQQQDF